MTFPKNPTNFSGGSVKYCRACGKKIGDNALSCPKCGEPIKVKSKSKVTAVVLAVLLSQWTWAYTYKKDGWKFWLGLILNFMGLFMYMLPNIVVWVWSILDAGVKDDEWYQNYYLEE